MAARTSQTTIYETKLKNGRVSCLRWKQRPKRSPPPAYIGLVKVIQSRWNFIMRTIPGSELHMQPLEAKLRNVISLLVYKTLSDLERDIIAWPCSAGGLGLINPTECASRFYKNSVKLTNKLKNTIIAEQDLNDYTKRTGRAEISGSNRKHEKKPLKLCIPEVRLK